ncbi:hypothetical protein YC2023_020602 [Brassica napus]
MKNQVVMIIVDNIIRDLILQFYKSENVCISWLHHLWMKKPGLAQELLRFFPIDARLAENYRVSSDFTASIFFQSKRLKLRLYMNTSVLIFRLSLCGRVIAVVGINNLNGKALYILNVVASVGLGSWMFLLSLSQVRI